MRQWDAFEVIADSESLEAETAVTADISELTSPTVLVELENLEGNADDDTTIRVVGEAATYEIDSRTLSELGSYTVDIPQADSVEFESSGGVTYSAEVRANA